MTSRTFNNLPVQEDCLTSRHGSLNHARKCLSEVRALRVSVQQCLRLEREGFRQVHQAEIRIETKLELAFV